MHFLLHNQAQRITNLDVSLHPPGTIYQSSMSSIDDIWSSMREGVDKDLQTQKLRLQKTKEVASSASRAGSNSSGKKSKAGGGGGGGGDSIEALLAKAALQESEKAAKAKKAKMKEKREVCARHVWHVWDVCSRVSIINSRLRCHTGFMCY